MKKLGDVIKQLTWIDAVLWMIPVMGFTLAAVMRR